MIRSIYIYLYKLLTLALMLPMTGCSNESEPPYPDTTDGSYLTFRIVAPKAQSSQAPASRASVIIPDLDPTQYWAQNYFSENGVDFDNAILKNQFEVVITKADGTQITSLTDVICVETTVSNDLVYTFSGLVPKDDVDKLMTYSDARIHVLANCGTSASLQGDMTYSHYGQPSTDFTAIPMWGVKEYDFSGLKRGSTFIGDIDLLRAMARVEIVNNAATENTITKLVSATVNHVNTQGYVLPNEWRSLTATRNLSYANSLRPNATNGNATKGEYTADAENKIVFYLPDTQNSFTNTKPSRDKSVTVSLTYEYLEKGKTQTETGTIKFVKYDNGAATDTYFNIVRNHLYRFVVTKGEIPELTIYYTVCPWMEYTVNPPVFD